MFIANLPMRARVAVATPDGAIVARRLNTPLATMDPKASHRRPQMSKTKVRKVSAGNSVAEAMVKVIKISSWRLPTFRTWPSKQREIAIQITIKRIVIRRKRGLRKRSKTEYVLSCSSAFFSFWQLSCTAIKKIMVETIYSKVVI